MTETTKMRIAVTLYRMYDTLVSRNTDVCFISDYDDYMSQRDNEYIKRYLRNQHCLIKKVSECNFFNGLSAEWKVDKYVLMSLLRQYNIYIKDVDTYNETLNKLRNKQIKHEDKNIVNVKKHLSEAPKVFSSKHHCKYYINSLAEVYDLVKERYPFWDDIQNKIQYINERNIDLPKINMGINIKHRKGVVSKVSCRYSNCLVSMKAHETTKNGYTERELYCMKKGLNYSFDVNASIHRLTYMLNNNNNLNGDVYEHIHKTAFPNGKWNNEIRAKFKEMMMRNYFDTSARNAAKNYINYVKKEKHYCPNIEKTREVFERIYPALRAVEGPTFDNEIFFWESVVMINLIYKMMQMDPNLKVFSVYDGIYFNNPVKDVEAMWVAEAKSTCALLLLASTQKAAVTSLCSNNPISKQQISYLAANTIFCQTQYCSRELQTKTKYTLTDNLAFFHSLANNNAQVLHLNDLARENWKLTMFSNGSSIEMVESRRNNAAKGKGVKHNSENMKGVKHDKKTGVLTKIKALGLTNITDKKLFVAECEKLGIKRRTAYSWFELVNIK